MGGAEGGEEGFCQAVVFRGKGGVFGNVDSVESVSYKDELANVFFVFSV